MTQDFVSNLISKLEQEKEQAESIEKEIRKLSESSTEKLSNLLQSVQNIIKEFSGTAQNIAAQAEELDQQASGPMQDTARLIKLWVNTIMNLMQTAENSVSAVTSRINQITTDLDSLVNHQDLIKQCEIQLKEIQNSYQLFIEQITLEIGTNRSEIVNLIEQSKQITLETLGAHQSAIQLEMDNQISDLKLTLKARYTLILISVLVLIMSCLLFYASKETYSKNAQLSYLDSQIQQRQLELNKYNMAIQQRQTQLSR